MKQVCDDYHCRWHGDSSDVLTAANPFDTKDIVVGCPKCLSVNTIRTACDEPDCWEQAVAGTPIPGGYRMTCSKHAPQTKDDVGYV